MACSEALHRDVGGLQIARSQAGPQHKRRNTDTEMYGLKKSDAVIVAVKEANNGRQRLAEPRTAVQRHNRWETAAPQLSRENCRAVGGDIDHEYPIQNTRRIGIPDRQYEDYMKLRTQHTQYMAAAKAGFSQHTGLR